MIFEVLYSLFSSLTMKYKPNSMSKIMSLVTTMQTMIQESRTKR